MRKDYFFLNLVSSRGYCHRDTTLSMLLNYFSPDVLLTKLCNTHFQDFNFKQKNEEGKGCLPIHVHLHFVEFFLLFSCLSHFYILRLFQIVLLHPSCEEGRREVRSFVGRRVLGIASCVPSFQTVSQLGELRKLINAPLMQNEEL